MAAVFWQHRPQEYFASGGRRVMDAEAGAWTVRRVEAEVAADEEGAVACAAGSARGACDCRLGGGGACACDGASAAARPNGLGCIPT